MDPLDPVPPLGDDVPWRVSALVTRLLAIDARIDKLRAKIRGASS